MVNDRGPRPCACGGAAIVDEDGERGRLKGVNVGAWLDIENLITRCAGNESMMRAAMAVALAPSRYEPLARS